MLDKFKKFFNEEKVVEMSDKQENQEAVAALSALQASYDTQAAELKAALEQIAEMKQAMEEFSAQKEQAEKSAAEAIAKAKQEKLEHRMSMLSKEFGDEKATKFSKFAETMEDAEFNEVFGIQKELSAKEEESFKEAGVDAKVAEDKKPAHFKQFIKGNK